MLKRRENYAPPAFLVASADLDINIHDHRTIVTTKLAITPNPDAIEPMNLQLDGRAIQLMSSRLMACSFEMMRLNLMIMAFRLED